MNSKTSEDIKNYYRQKRLYESKINKKKSDIIKNKSLNINEKKRLFKEFKPICINCKKPGGTIFKNEGHFLIATCNVAQPCSLDLRINRGLWKNLRISEENAANEVNNLQTKIIETKLKLLFNYKNEDETIDSFNELKKQLNLWSNSLLKLRNDYIDIIDNPEQKASIKENETNLFVEKIKLDELKKKYKETQQPEIITEMVEAYVSVLKPLAEKIRETKYKYSGIEYIDDDIFLIELPYTLNEIYIDNSDK
tara:strand:- start:46 stop:801 length:756 start_codon:yes stop_codon:yes gene_type:complete